MQVIDSSALLAIIYREPEQELFSEMLARRSGLISTVNLHEAQVAVFRRLGEDQASQVRALLDDVDASIVPFDAAHADLALSAYARFGKGRHPAKLNLCDCAAYALAKSRDLPLLYKGNDFAQTDIAAAVTGG